MWPDIRWGLRAVVAWWCHVHDHVTLVFVCLISDYLQWLCFYLSMKHNRQPSVHLLFTREANTVSKIRTANNTCQSSFIYTACTSSGVLLNMEVGICKRVWHTCIQYTLLIYDHWGEYTLSKKPGVWCTAYTPQYTTVYQPTVIL